MEALFVSGDHGNGRENNTSQYRIHGPAKYLAKAGHTILFGNMPGQMARHTDIPKNVEVDALDYSQVREVVLFERNITPERVELLRLAGAKRIIVTFDDHYGWLPPYMASSSYWENNYSKFLKALGMVDLVVVPSIKLVSQFSGYAKKIQYLPNYLDPERWPDPSLNPENILGWGGSLGHVESWRDARLNASLREFLKLHPDWVFRYFGVSRPDWMLNHPQVQLNSWVPFDEWPNQVNQFKLGIAPLHGDYDTCRSNLKLLEYQRLGIPWVATKDIPYNRPVVLKGGRLTKNSWLDELHELASNTELYRELSTAGRSESEAYLMSDHISEYEQILWGEL